ncbi:hypothetical protein D3C83_107740 [compost metagenome]
MRAPSQPSVTAAMMATAFVLLNALVAASFWWTKKAVRPISRTASGTNSHRRNRRAVAASEMRMQR